MVLGIEDYKGGFLSYNQTNWFLLQVTPKHIRLIVIRMVSGDIVTGDKRPFIITLS